MEKFSSPHFNQLRIVQMIAFIQTKNIYTITYRFIMKRSEKLRRTIIFLKENMRYKPKEGLCYQEVVHFEKEA